MGDGGGVIGGPVVEPFQGLAGDDALFHDLGRVLRLDLGIEEVLGIDGDQGPCFAEAVAAGADHVHLLVQALGGQFLFQGLGHGAAALRVAAGVVTDHDMVGHPVVGRGVRAFPDGYFGQSLLLKFIQRGGVRQAGQFGVIFFPLL